MAPLTIYKASAGSGKTFQLTMGYLELLFKDPMAYRHILAVTFTNKAASEMKSRILERLFLLSKVKPAEHSDDLDLLEKSTGLSKEEIVSKSREILVRVLNDYSRFSVGTIDRFFQGVIRAFTREIGLSAGFNLELDRNRILGEAIDRMFQDLGEDKALLEWLLRFAESRIEDSRAWNFRAEIENLGQELFSESYQEIMLTDDHEITREQIKDFIADLHRRQKVTKQKMQEIAETVSMEIRSSGYTIDDFYRKASGLAAFFDKVSSGEKESLTSVQKQGRSDLSKWISKNESDQNKIHFIENTLMPGMASIYEEVVVLNTITQINQYLFTLGILGDLSDRILDITDEKNLFLLSDASRFLKGLIGSNPTPFIYEKSGNFIEHIMLDEFQDTSVFQWENFRPLIEHSLSIGQESIIVGDVKQSIYRWRNSDWKILADVVENSFQPHEMKSLSLTDNWRSKENLIRFNNTIFSQAPGLINDLVSAAMEEAFLEDEFKSKWGGLINRAYNEIEQHIPEKAKNTGGFVKGEVLSDDEENFKELALKKIPDWIRELQDLGYGAGDIAILVRTNKEGANIAKELIEIRESETKYNFNFVSNESLFLNSNPAVKFILSLLTFMNNDADELNNISLKYYCQLCKPGLQQNPSESLYPDVSLEEILGESFFSELPLLKRLPLFELVESLISKFELDKNAAHLPYIQAFQETLLELQQSEPGGLHDFLNYWKDFGSKKSISVSEEQDAIRIVTIHKAKGLQFKAVILPFCDWDLSSSASGNKDTILWCPTDGTPFDSIPLVPIKFKKGASETLFASKYFEELIMGYVDSLNILYVALTRAEEVMIIGLPEQAKENDLKKSGHLLMTAAQNGTVINEIFHINLRELTDNNGFKLGSIEEIKRKTKENSDPWIIGQYPVKLRNKELRLHLKSKEYFLTNKNEREDHRNFGNIMHDIFSLVNTPKDIDFAIQKYQNEGYLKDEDAKRLKELISKKLDNPQVKNWFSDDNEILNEREIMSEGESYRPDRVILQKDKAIVIDYKFGDQELHKYEKQITKYMELLHSMKYQHIKGYLWYVMMDKIVEIK